MGLEVLFLPSKILLQDSGPQSFQCMCYVDYRVIWGIKIYSPRDVLVPVILSSSARMLRWMQWGLGIEVSRWNPGIILTKTLLFLLASFCHSLLPLSTAYLFWPPPITTTTHQGDDQWWVSLPLESWTLKQKCLLGEFPPPVFPSWALNISWPPPPPLYLSFLLQIPTRRNKDCWKDLLLPEGQKEEKYKRA